MSELLHVHVVSANIRTCFFYRSNKIPFAESHGNVWAVEIRYGENYRFSTYGSIARQALAGLPENSLGMSRLLASELNLKAGDPVLVSTINCASISSLQLMPSREEDYLACRKFIEENLLDQVRVVGITQVLPLHVFSNITIDVRVGNLKPAVKVGQLEKMTEVTILHNWESESDRKLNSASSCTCAGLEYKDLTRRLNQFLAPESRLIEGWNQLVWSSSEGELNFKGGWKNEFVVWPESLLPAPFSSVKTSRTFVFVPALSHANIVHCFGPSSLKVLCKVQRVTLEGNPRGESECGERPGILERVGGTEKESGASDEFRCFAVGLKAWGPPACRGRRKIAFCPLEIRQKLNISVGDRLKIEKVDAHTEKSGMTESERRRKRGTLIFQEAADRIKQTVDNSLRFDGKMNILLVGRDGMGKTRLANYLAQCYKDECIHTKMVSCKCLRGKKVESLRKILSDVMAACCRSEPSVLFLDDLNALTRHEHEEGENSGVLYSDGVVSAIADLIESFQANHNLCVVATATGLSDLGRLVSARGPRVFPHVEVLEDMSPINRHRVLVDLMRTKGRQARNESLDLGKIAGATAGFTVRNLSDLFDKAVLEWLLRGGKTPLNEADFERAMLSAVGLPPRHRNPAGIGEKSWEKIGGLEMPKKVLAELFSWPSLYPELLESCPLRLQRGVLLYGAPGTGKTLLARALAEKCSLNFVSVKGPEVLSKYVGASEEAVRNLFVEAQKKRPSLLFFDEFESLAPKRGRDGTGVSDRVVNQLLTQLDGVETVDGIWVLAATNRPDLVDPALLRPGRLDKLLFCDLPDEDERLAILEVQSRHLVKSEDASLCMEEVARKTEDFTGADLQALLSAAQILAVEEGFRDARHRASVVIEQKHLRAALDATKPSLTKPEKLGYEKIYETFSSSRKKRTGTGCPPPMEAQKLMLA